MLRDLLADSLSFFFPAECPFCGDEAVLEWGVCMDCEICLPWFEPPWCAACGRPLDAGGVIDTLCSDCVIHRPAFDHAFSLLSYEETVKKAVTRFKYGRDATLAAGLGATFGRSLPAYVNPFPYDLLTAVPLHNRRLRWRGFNQAMLLAAAVGSRFGLPVARRLLVRTRETKAQASLDRAGRLENLAGAFSVADPKRVAGKRILVFDDVLTTGATLEACAVKLKEAGASRVDVITIARALPMHGP
jgi:ComF family protein